MVEAGGANKRSVMVLGSLGTGKSSFLNTLSGIDLEVDDEPFESAFQTTGCT